MHRISARKACFLSKFAEIMPSPRDLVNLLDQVIQLRLFVSFVAVSKERGLIKILAFREC